jgi:SAM-dependent methyltransferase
MNSIGLASLIDCLRCPATGETLIDVDGELRSSSHTYRIVDGVPLLLDPEQSAFSVEDPQPPAPVSAFRRLLRRLIPDMSPAGNAAARFQRFVDEIKHRSEAPAILVIGGGNLGKGAEVLFESPGLTIVETDVYLGPRTNIVCDGHSLPFADSSFDGVVIQAVLEHVLDPVKVVAEIHRVLEPLGVVFAETPFMQHVHEGPYDFTRWTETGHRRLFRMFTAIETGVTAGPAVTLLWSLAYLARTIPRRHITRLAAEKLTIICFAWLKPLDALLLSRAGATDGASGVYFLGSRAEQPVADSDVIALYRGAIGTPSRR